MSTAEVIEPVVTTTNGLVMGREKNGVLLFCGIPYAASPAGERRFKRAIPPEDWGEIRDATRFGPAAPQIPSGGLTDSAPVRWDEDCLSLNVCTPGIDESKRPVLVWIHGGAYRSGQGAVPWYNGTSFAVNGDIVVVSINYRLGALGFTDLSRFGDDYATSGINGLLDQITALEWVRDNIANFGGNPERVTIAGESAGGFSVTTLLGSERAQGLFSRAIPQSGAAHHTLTPEVGSRVTDLLLEEMQADSIADLLSASPLDLLEAQGRVDVRFHHENISSGVQAFYPVEGNEVLPGRLMDAIRAGIGAGVPVLVGTNKDESTLFTLGKVSTGMLNAQIERYGADKSLLDAYRTLLPGASETEISVALATDFAFKIPAVRLAEARAANGSETWMYQFDWESRAGHLKATHALEIPFSFNTLSASGVEVFIGKGDKPQHVADEMHLVWTGFIRGDEPDWPKYDVQSRATRHFDNESSLVENGEEARLQAWQGIR